MGSVILGMDPHKASATIEVIDGRERVLGGGRYATGGEDVVVSRRQGGL